MLRIQHPKQRRMGPCSCRVCVLSSALTCPDAIPQQVCQRTQPQTLSPNPLNRLPYAGGPVPATGAFWRVQHRRWRRALCRAGPRAGHRQQPGRRLHLCSAQPCGEGGCKEGNSSCFGAGGAPWPQKASCPELNRVWRRSQQLGVCQHLCSAQLGRKGSCNGGKAELGAHARRAWGQSHTRKWHASRCSSLGLCCLRVLGPAEVALV